MDIKNKLKEYIDNNLEKTFVIFRKAWYSVEKACCCSNAELNDIEFIKEEKSYQGEVNSLNNFIDSNKDDNKFQKLLFKYIDDRTLEDSDVYNKVHIDRRLFSKIRNDSDYHPNKETIILLGLAIELNEN